MTMSSAEVIDVAAHRPLTGLLPASGGLVISLAVQPRRLAVRDRPL
jgi:hypothetical protein